MLTLTLKNKKIKKEKNSNTIVKLKYYTKYETS